MCIYPQSRAVSIFLRPKRKIKSLAPALTQIGSACVCTLFTQPTSVIYLYESSLHIFVVLLLISTSHGPRPWPMRLGNSTWGHACSGAEKLGSYIQAPTLHSVLIHGDKLTHPCRKPLKGITLTEQQVNGVS